MSFYSERIFPNLLNVTTSFFEEDRRALFGSASGRVLELGVGTGVSLEHYPGSVTELVAIDPEHGMLRRSRDRVRALERRPGGLPFRVRLQRADAEALPYDDDSFDTVVAALTLCTIPDPDRAAAEMRRVLRPTGRLLVLEHVRAHREGMLAWWQDRLDPLWTRVAGGCHINRDTGATLERAGFDTRSLERYHDQSFFPPASPRLRGVVPGRPESGP